MKKYNQKKMFLTKKKIIIILLIILFILITILLSENRGKERIIAKQKIIPITKNKLEKIQENYSDYVILKNKSNLYEKEKNTYQKVATIKGTVELSLDPNYIVEDKYFKIKDSNYYIKYTDITKIDNLSPLFGEYKTYSNYIPYNESIILKNKAKFYLPDNSYYELEKGIFPLLIKNDDKYGIEFNHSLVYVSKEDVKEVINQENTEKKHTN